MIRSLRWLVVDWACWRLEADQLQTDDGAWHHVIRVGDDGEAPRQALADLDKIEAVVLAARELVLQSGEANDGNPSWYEVHEEHMAKLKAALAQVVEIEREPQEFCAVEGCTDHTALGEQKQ